MDNVKVITCEEDSILNNIEDLIELSRFYKYDDDEEYLNHIKNLEKLKNKIEDGGLSSVIREDD